MKEDTAALPLRCAPWDDQRLAALLVHSSAKSGPLFAFAGRILNFTAAPLGFFQELVVVFWVRYCTRTLLGTLCTFIEICRSSSSCSRLTLSIDRSAQRTSRLPKVKEGTSHHYPYPRRHAPSPLSLLGCRVVTPLSLTPTVRASVHVHVVGAHPPPAPDRAARHLRRSAPLESRVDVDDGCHARLTPRRLVRLEPTCFNAKGRRR